jgi:tripeptide aminopeptidase
VCDGERLRRGERKGEIQRATGYPPFNLEKNAPILIHAERAAEAIGLKPTTIFSNGGLDANWLVKHGVCRQ